MKDDALDKAVELVDNKIESAEEQRRGIGLSVSNVNVDFSGIKALQNISFSIAAGEKVGVFGNNGSGKSTLCDVICGIIQPDDGSMEINNRQADSKGINWRARKGLRRTFEQPVYFDDLTIEENVMIGSPPFKGDGPISSLFLPRLFHKERRETARRILQYCNIDIDEAQNQRVLPYSTKKKIELARALMGNPRVLILDEPASGLEEEERAQYSQVVGDYVETFSTTLIIVEHDIDMIRSLCQRAIAIDAGEVIADGEVIPVLRNPDVIELYFGGGGST